MIKIKRIGNDKTLINDKELKGITNNAYQKGVVFGCSTVAGVIRKHIDKLTPDNIDEVKSEIIKFCDNVIAVQVRQKGEQNNGQNEHN